MQGTWACEAASSGTVAAKMDQGCMAHNPCVVLLLGGEAAPPPPHAHTLTHTFLRGFRMVSPS